MSWHVRQRLLERVGNDRYSRPSLHGIEDRLDELTGGRPGFFVEAGAFDGFHQSNTYWLERFRGWRGVLVEPVPENMEACRKLRQSSVTVHAALVSDDHDGSPVTIRHAGLMSIAVGAQGSAEADDGQVAAGLAAQPGLDTYEVRVVARTLTSVLAESNAPREIDLLSLDVEGFEPDVLAGLDVDRFTPRYVLVEMNKPDAVRRILMGMGYEMVDAQLTPQDALFRLARPVPGRSTSAISVSSRRLSKLP